MMSRCAWQRPPTPTKPTPMRSLAPYTRFALAAVGASAPAVAAVPLRKVRRFSFFFDIACVLPWFCQWSVVSCEHDHALFQLTTDYLSFCISSHSYSSFL